MIIKKVCLQGTWLVEVLNCNAMVHRIKPGHPTHKSKLTNHSVNNDTEYTPVKKSIPLTCSIFFLSSKTDRNRETMTSH